MKNTNTIQLNSETLDLINDRLDYIQSSIRGERRLRSYRWEGQLSLRDAHRICVFLSTILEAGGKIAAHNYVRLVNEIPLFSDVVTSKIDQKIKEAING